MGIADQGPARASEISAVELTSAGVERTLTYAGAGHPPLLLRAGSSKCVRDVTENGLFLGRFPFATYSSVELPLNAGDRALLYTDGIPETTNAAGVNLAAAV